MLEMRSQGPYKEAFADRFQQNDEYVRYMLRTVIDHGISEGEFTDVDSEHVARALMTIVDGGRTRAVVLGETDTLATARRTADEYVNAVLRADKTGVERSNTD
jgi:predicted rRNA methylase YqxC with S4 and FtsJ domains